jgi:DNA-binding NarL/FixJ family response regulator
MAFGGNLEDLPFSDIIQLLHVSKKSGTLSIVGATGTTQIVCQGGFIMDATFPGGGVSISHLLLQAKLVTKEQLERVQTKFLPREVDGARLVMGLIDAGYLSKENGNEQLRKFIHQTLAEIITWKEGDFSFDVDDSVGEGNRDDLSIDMLYWSGVDTQGALMDAFRVFDEKNRRIEAQKERKKERIKEAVARSTLAPGPPMRSDERPSADVPEEAREVIPKDQETEDIDLLSVLDEMDEESLDEVLSPPMHALILSDDSFTKYSMYRLCRDNGIWVTVSDVESDLRVAFEMGVAEGHSMALVVDLGSEPFDSLRTQRRLAVASRMKMQNQELPLVVLGNVTEQTDTVKLFELGARTVLTRSGKSTQDAAKVLENAKGFNSVILGCLKGIFREEYRLRLAVQEIRSQMASLKRRVQEIQDRKNSLDVSIITLQFVAELLHRGILFLVRKTDLLGLGSFGMSGPEGTLSAAAMRIRIPLDVKSVFSDVVDEGVVYYGASEDSIVKESLYSHIGAPASAEFLLLPLKTENKTIALVYCDFGEKPASPTIKTDALEILASQVGMAMEIALYHRRDEKKATVAVAD